MTDGTCAIFSQMQLIFMDAYFVIQNCTYLQQLYYLS